MPVAPGTFGSIIAVLFIYFLQPGPLELSLLIIIFFTAGILFTHEVEKVDGKDPSHIVIDEVVGQWLVFLFISSQSIFVLSAGFLLFRIFDILKPFWIDKLQNLKGGWGVMLDDILAGVYVNLILQFLIYTGFTL